MAQKTTAWILLATMWVGPAAFGKTKAKNESAPVPTQEATKPAAAANPNTEKLDVSDLENKYWAPKDTDFSVVQNRTYSKEHKLFVSVQGGPDLNNDYLSGNHFGLTGNYFFNERYGVQFSYLDSTLHSKRLLGDLAEFGKGIEPDHGKMTNYYGV